METSELKNIDIEKAKEHLRRLEHLLNDYSDEIPDYLVSGSGNFKVRRGNWFGPVFDTVDLIFIDGYDSDVSLKKDLDKLSTEMHQRSKEWADAVNAGTNEGDYLKTTKEEIDAANDILKRMIKNLQNIT